MHKKHKGSFHTIIVRSAQSVILTTVILILFTLSNKNLIGEFLFYETMPYYTLTGTAPVFLKLLDTSRVENEDLSEEKLYETALKETDDSFNVAKNVSFLEDDYIETYNPERIGEDVLNTTPDIIGLNDIIYQDEEEFGRIPDSGYKENFTSADLDRLMDVDYLLGSFYNKDSNAGIIKDRFNAQRFLSTDLSLEKKADGPQVLIFHTHGSTEFFIDSDTSNLYDGVIGAGERLKYVLENKYGIQALHHTAIYDMDDGKSSRQGSYERMEPDILRVLQENPTIEFVVDIHRDGIEPNPDLVTVIDGKPYAKIMFVNGLSAINRGGEVSEIDYLYNPYLDTNLALSFNMQMAANTFYPDFTRRIYLKTYRFSTHMMPKSLLVEIGSQYNTKEEAFNAMELLADLINQVVFTG